jgi:hypothetical protein
MPESRKSQPDPASLVSSTELAEIIGTDLETVDNWLRRGIIARARVGGRQLRSRLFSTDEVYKAALINELVKLGLGPSSASDAVSQLWSQWKKRGGTEKIFAVMFPDGKDWSVLLCWQKTASGLLYKMGRSAASKSEEVELPKQGFAVLPISDILDRVTERLSKVFRT